MPSLKSKFMGAAAATAAALFVAFAPVAQSHDELWHQLDITDGYTPSPPHSPAMKTEAGSRSEQGTDFVGTGARRAPEAMMEYCDRWAEQLRLSDGYNTPRC